MILDCSGTRYDICRGADGIFEIDCRTSLFARVLGGVELSESRNLGLGKDGELRLMK